MADSAMGLGIKSRLWIIAGIAEAGLLLAFAAALLAGDRYLTVTAILSTSFIIVIITALVSKGAEAHLSFLSDRVGTAANGDLTVQIQCDGKNGL